MLTPTDGWAASDATSILLHYDGTSWTPVTVPHVAGITSLDMLSANEGWAAGDSGVLMHYLNGTWTEYQS